MLLLITCYFHAVKTITRTPLLLMLCYGIAANSQTADTASINAMLVRSRALLTTNIDSSLLLAEQAINLSNKINYTAGLAKAYNSAGVAHMNLGNYGEASDHYNKAIAAYRSFGDSSGVAQAYAMKGVNNGFQNLPAEALQWFLRSLRLREQLKEQPQIADIKLKIGLVYDLSGDLTKALQYTHDALKAFGAMGDKRGMLNCYNNLGIFYGKSKQPEKALEVLQKGKIYATELGMHKVLGDVALNTGKVYTGLQQYTTANTHLSEALSWYRKVNFPLGISRTLSAIGENHLYNNNIIAAEQAAKESNVFAMQIGNTRLVYDNYDILADAARRAGNYREALQYSDSLLVLKDSIYNADKTELLASTRHSYELDKKEQAIKLLEQENVAKTAQRNMILLLAIFGVVVVVVLAFLYYQLKKKNKVLNEQRKKLQEMNQVRDKFFSILSHDLRTPLASIISVIDMMGKEELKEEERMMIRTQLRSSAASTLDTMENILFWANNQLRDHPSVKEQVNLHDITEQAANLYETTALNKEIKIMNAISRVQDVWFDKDQLSFIIRNLVANAVKFSYPGSMVVIDAHASTDAVSLSVADTGTGIDEKYLDEILQGKGKRKSKGTNGELGSGIGLVMVHDFLEKNNATLSVHTEKGKGSMFVIRIPNVKEGEGNGL